MGYNVREDWQQDKPRVDEIIREMRAKGERWNDVAAKLNKEGIRSKGGLKWHGATATSYGLKEGVVPRSVNTVAGAAGSTGYPKAPTARRYSPLNGLAKKKCRSPGQKESISDSEIEEIMTSNLATSLKLKVVRIVALSRG